MLTRKLPVITSLIFMLCCFKAWGTVAYEWDIHGLNDPLLKNVESRMAISRKVMGKTLHRTSVQALYKQGPSDIRKALQPYGYFRPVISSELKQKDRRYIAVFDVQHGPTLPITSLDVQIVGAGKNDPELKKLVKDLPLKLGQVFTTKNYEQAKKRLFEIAEQRGFITAQLDIHTATVDLTTYSAEIILHLNTGPRYYFGDVKFSESKLSPAFLQRFVHFKHGSRYTSNDILILQDNLSNSGYFQQVMVKPQIDDASNHQVPIDVALTPRKRQHYLFGGGFGTDTGVRVRAGWQLRRVNQWGHKFGVQAYLSQLQDSLHAVYTIPGTDPLTESYHIAGSLYDINSKAGDSRTHELSVNYLKLSDNWQRTMAITYQRERFSLSGDQSTEKTRLLMPSVTWTKKITDDQIFPSQGYKVSMYLRGATDELLSDHNFLQGSLIGNLIDSFGDRQRLVLHGKFGYSIIQHYNQFPLSLRFLSGGAHSVRGYDFQSLGPGRYQQEASIEYQLRTFGKWYALAFYDVGNSFDKFGSHSNNEEGIHIGRLTGVLKQGIGGGIMWASPIGPIKITYAIALDKRDKPSRIQFTMGPEL